LEKPEEIISNLIVFKMSGLLKMILTTKILFEQEGVLWYLLIVERMKISLFV